jgi:8-amino-7-oxononanoate synthase
MANLGIVPALVGRGDAVFADRLNHASLIDAVQLSRADSQRYPHGDLAALERLLAASPASRKLILSDAVFSMDGDLAPLPGLLDLAERFDAWLVIDDAHGFGVLGPQGRGSLAHFQLPPPDACSTWVRSARRPARPALSSPATRRSSNGWNSAHAPTSSPLPAARRSPAHCSPAWTLIADGDDRRRHLGQLIAQLRDGLAGTRWRLLPSPTAIQPVIIGDNHEALRIASALYERGLWVPAIRPPTVPTGTARLRVSLTASHTVEQLAQLVDALRELA